MTWKPNRKLPICPQICEQICVWIAAGQLQPHARLSSVREMALTLDVNPNTVQRSYEQLDQMGVLYSVPGVGWYVSEDTAAVRQIADQLIRQKMTAFFEDMASLGLDEAAVKRYVEEWKYE